ncbi:MAG: hypothetical protein GXO93_01440 [FCB group bacterium]|nr:hypothetical protein [FCB group bacterium]
MKQLIVVLLFLFTGPKIDKYPAIERPHFTYYFDNPAYVKIADSSLSVARNKLLKLLNDTLPYKPSVYIVDDIDIFRKLTWGKFPDWGAGAAFPERQLIAIKDPAKFPVHRSLKELLAHEYTHLVIADKIGFHTVPRWFNEGMAMYISMEWGWGDNLAMSKSAVFGQFVRLKDIERVNRFNESKAQVAYSESYLAVEYMVKNYGKHSLAVYLDSLSVGVNENKALEAAVGAYDNEFENEFKQYLNQRFNVVSLFMDTMFFWLGLAIIVVIAGFMRFKRRRKYYKKWKEEETWQSTDFDYGDPDHPEKIDDDDRPWLH